MAEPPPVPSILEGVNLRDAGAVIDVLERGREAMLGARCRRGAVDHVRLTEAEADAGARMILTGDLHDNPLHLARLVSAARLDGSGPPSHLTLHELIHGDRLTNGMDFSYRVLARVAALKAAYPEHVHILLANHELSQVVGAGIVKDGVRVVEAFNEALAYAFGDEAPRVDEAVKGFIRAMPLAARFSFKPAAGEAPADVLCAHSLPAPELMERFDPAVLERETGLSEDDLAPRRGSAYLMTWGRDHTPEHLDMLAKRWNVGIFVLGHEKAEAGVFTRPPNAVVLNSDHGRGVYLDLDPRTERTVEAFAAAARPLAMA